MSLIERSPEAATLTLKELREKSPQVRFTCGEHVDWEELEKLHYYQGDLTETTTEALDKLEYSIRSLGFFKPVEIWQDEESLWQLVDGHARKRVLHERFNYSGKIPVNRVQARSHKEASEMVIASRGQTNRTTHEGLAGFLNERNLDAAMIEFYADMPDIDYGAVIIEMQQIQETDNGEAVEGFFDASKLPDIPEAENNDAFIVYVTFRERENIVKFIERFVVEDERKKLTDLLNRAGIKTVRVDETQTIPEEK